MFNFEFLLSAKNDGLLPPFTGHLLRGAILKLIKEHDEELSEKLHEGNKIRPYCLSPLYSKNNRMNRTRRGEIITKDNKLMKFRFGILTEELAERMVKITLLKDQKTLELANNEFKIVSIEIKNTNAKELLQRKLVNGKFQLKFLTPTYFNISKQDFPLRFPDPRYLFMNLATLWNTFNVEKILVDQEELFEWVENHISITGYNLKTRTEYIAKGVPKIGFKGWVHYQLSGDESYQQWITALCSFAEYSNVGANRTAGFGCVKFSLRE
ncbi:MAG: CRISPR-associated endoribonuclease Cas6 [Candidatus Heimdallarchaeota archaeon]